MPRIKCWSVGGADDFEFARLQGDGAVGPHLRPAANPHHRPVLRHAADLHERDARLLPPARHQPDLLARQATAEQESALPGPIGGPGDGSRHREIRPPELEAGVQEVTQAAGGVAIAVDEGLEGRVQALLDEVDELRRQAEALERTSSLQSAEGLLQDAQDVNGVTVLAAMTSASNNDSLREISDWLRDKLVSGIVVLGAVINDWPAFVAMVTPDLVSQGRHAGDIIREVARVAGGGGGGRPELAQAGGKDKTKLKAALALVPGLVKKA